MEHDARRGADVTRSVFTVKDLHLLLLVGLPTHYQKQLAPAPQAKRLPPGFRQDPTLLNNCIVADWSFTTATGYVEQRRPRPQYTPHAASGDHAGSDASVGVGANRSLNPVMSTDARCDE